jgi:hypothetical protein
MTSPYKKYLQVFEKLDNEVTIDRANAESIQGKVEEAGDDACVIKARSKEIGVARMIFVAYSDIRGVGHNEHDLG